MPYKIRTFTNGANRKGEPFRNHSLTVPSHLARLLPKGLEFHCQLTDDGILYRPVKPQRRHDDDALPAWVDATAP
jgi:hypothetical protein